MVEVTGLGATFGVERGFTAAGRTTGAALLMVEVTFGAIFVAMIYPGFFMLARMPDRPVALLIGVSVETLTR